MPSYVVSGFSAFDIVLKVQVQSRKPVALYSEILFNKMPEIKRVDELVMLHVEVSIEV